MDPQLYKAAQLGHLDVIQKFGPKLETQLTPSKNTVLHVLAQFCDSSYAAEEILAIESKLPLKLNARREIPLHIAARNGNVHVVQALIDFAKRLKMSRSMLRLRNEDGDLALHEAVRNNCLGVVRLLVEEDPQFSHGKNDAEESPLYIAIEKGYHSIAALILSNCKTPSYVGPNQRTALHAAVIWNFPECLKLMLERIPSLTKVADELGWTPLHFAAKFNRQEMARQLLRVDRCMAYSTSQKKDDQRTALLVAVSFGHLQLVEEILWYCPDCWEKVTYSSWNMIHTAVAYEQQEVLELILQKSWVLDLINQKDSRGNTPLHFYVTTKHLKGYNLVNHPKVDKNAFNDTGLTPLDLIQSPVNERQVSIKNELTKAGATPGLRIFTVPANPKDEPEKFARMADTYLIVATLIITVTFAAGFTIPGGYDSSDGPRIGMAILAKKAAFNVFIVSDLLAFMSSLDAVLRLFKFQRATTRLTKLHRLDRCRSRIGFAFVAMVIALVTGLYVVLPTLGIRIFLCVAAALFAIPVRKYFRWSKMLQGSKRWTYNNRKANYSVYIFGMFKVWYKFREN